MTPNYEYFVIFLFLVFNPIHRNGYRKSSHAIAVSHL